MMESGAQVWNNFEGAVGNVYLINGTIDNNQSIRCLVTNTGGETYSEYVVRIGAAAASPSANPSSGGGSSRYLTVRS